MYRRNQRELRAMTNNANATFNIAYNSVVWWTRSKLLNANERTELARVICLEYRRERKKFLKTGTNVYIGLFATGRNGRYTEYDHTSPEIMLVPCFLNDHLVIIRLLEIRHTRNLEE